MPKEQYTTNLSEESHPNISKDLVNSSLPARGPPYRSISAKRPRDPSHRKSVSFNDVPIVYEVPSHDAMRSANCDVYRSWAYTDATVPTTTVIPSLYSTQVLSPLNSTNLNAQKLYANRLSSTLYTTSSSTTMPTPNRMPDWAIRPRTAKPVSTAEEIHATNETNSNWNTPVVVVHTPDEKINKDTTVKNTNQSTYSNPYMTYAQPLLATEPSLVANPTNQENSEEKKYPYRAPVIPDTDYFRNLSFSSGSLANPTATYTSILSPNLTQSQHPSNEHPTIGNTRSSRARSALIPPTVMQPPIRTNDPISITPFRMSTAAAPTPPPPSANGPMAATRTVLRPTTIAFQCSQSGSSAGTTTNTNNISSTLANMIATNNTNPSLTTTTTSSYITKPPSAPTRYGSSAAATAAAHSRFIIPPSRTYSTSTLTPSAMKYAFTHPAMESTLTNGMIPHTTVPKPPPTAYPRSRSANSLSMRRASASPLVVLNGQSHGGGTSTVPSTADPTSNLYATTRRSPNVRQTYGSYYMHRVLLPTTTN